MDLIYVFSSTTYYACQSIIDSTFEVQEAKARLVPSDKDVDAAVEARFEVQQPDKPTISCQIKSDLASPWLFGIIPKLWEGATDLSIELEGARIDFPQFAGPYFAHTITVTDKDSEGKLTKNKRTHQCYVGGPQWGEGNGARFWTTYRYQLEAFVNMVKAKEQGEVYRGPDVSLDDSVKLMGLVDAVYQKAGLPKRGL